jgi:beta-glucanase (GH16 family)
VFKFAKRFDAPSISSDFYILFGRVEVVMKAAPGVGIISSAVLMSDDQDEIDWEFSGNDFNMGSGNVQTNYFGKGIEGNFDRGTYPSVSSPQTEFHNYALEWSAEELIWSIDGVAVRVLPNDNATSGSYQYPQSPMKVELGLWDGGDPSNDGGTIEWAGGYTNFSDAPFTMYVKSVTVTNANPCSGGYQYTDMSGSYQSIECVSMDT